MDLNHRYADCCHHIADGIAVMEKAPGLRRFLDCYLPHEEHQSGPLRGLTVKKSQFNLNAFGKLKKSLFQIG